MEVQQRSYHCNPFHFLSKCSFWGQTWSHNKLACPIYSGQMKEKQIRKAVLENVLF
jgi:hypothetical protein